MITESEKELSVVVHSTLKPAAHIANCVKKENQVIDVVFSSSTLIRLDKDTFEGHLCQTVNTTQVESPVSFET